MELLIDTNRYTDMIRGREDVVERFDAAAKLWLPLIALAELLAGFAIGKNRESNEEKLASFLNWPTTGRLIPDAATARVYANITTQLRGAGKPIPTNDIWIAALAIQHDLILDTRDSHFAHVSGLNLIDVP